MTQLIANPLALWRKQQHACTLMASRAELELRLGAPLVLEVEEDEEPQVQWELHYDCGLELRLTLPRQQPHTQQEARVWMEHLEVEHLLAHLGLGFDRVLWRADAQEPLSLEGWAIVRQDDQGNRFDICVLSVPAHAECMARQMEARAHKQAYFVEPRGTPVQDEMPSLGDWSAIEGASAVA
jgi:hypothetical protein